MWRRFRERHSSLDIVELIDFMQELAAAGTRPATAIQQFRATVGLVCDAHNQPSPFEQKLLVRISNAIIRKGTTRSRDPGPLLRVDKVLRWLREQTLQRPSQITRAHAAAAVAAVLPSRPQELCRLRHEDVSVRWATNAVGVRDIILRTNRLPAELVPVLGRPTLGFTINISVLESKTDKRTKSGIRKMMQHPEGATWSPAMLLLAYMANKPHRTDADFVFPHADSAKRTHQLAVATISAELGRTAEAATGERVTARYWRPAAATWLLRAGLDVETVAALGGWGTTDSLRRFYVRATLLDDGLARTIAGEAPIERRHAAFAAKPPLQWTSIDELRSAVRSLGGDDERVEVSRTPQRAAAPSTPPPARHAASPQPSPAAARSSTPRVAPPARRTGGLRPSTKVPLAAAWPPAALGRTQPPPPPPHTLSLPPPPPPHTLLSPPPPPPHTLSSPPTLLKLLARTPRRETPPHLLSPATPRRNTVARSPPPLPPALRSAAHTGRTHGTACDAAAATAAPSGTAIGRRRAADAVATMRAARMDASRTLPPPAFGRDEHAGERRSAVAAAAAAAPAAAAAAATAPLGLRPSRRAPLRVAGAVAVPVARR